MSGLTYKCHLALKLLSQVSVVSARHWRFIHAVVSVSHLFLLLSGIPLLEYTTSVYSPGGRYLGCFQFLNNRGKLLWSCTYKSLCGNQLSFIGLLGSIVCIWLTVINCKLVFQGGCFGFPPTISENYSWSTSHWPLVLSHLWLTVLTGPSNILPLF